MLVNKNEDLPFKISRILFLVLVAVMLVLSIIIPMNDVSASTSGKGVALKNPTHVYASESRSSNILKSYSEGRILKYEVTGSEWNKAVVSVSGKWTTGFIHSSDVDPITENPTALKGIALKSPTPILSAPSSKAAVLRNYGQGTILKYRTFSSQWYEATISYKGEWRTGYIRKSDVETAFDSQETLKGVALKSPTAVYKNGSTAAYWKTYSPGTILSYKTFSENWYEAKVYIQGSPQSGYIRKSDVETAVSPQVGIYGIGTVQPTGIYPKATTSAKPLKTYPAGTRLYYRTFTSGWYQATVYVGGQKKTGYIKAEQTEQLLDNSQDADGRSIVAANIHKLASAHSSTVTTVPKGFPISLKTYTKNWYQASVTLNGKTYSGFIRADQVTTQDVVKTKSYNYTFSSFVDKQMKVDPKSDGAGKILATRDQVAHYSNPSNFPAGTAGYYQFLNLKSPAGLDANEINTRLLAGKGILAGQGQAFVNASYAAGLNEAYLIAHTLHETGNGTSVLSNGIPVDSNGKVTRDGAGEIAETAETIGKVYNMYGYGAKDACPIDCGAEYAFKKQWFTPADAIIGGAHEVGVNYINVGQDTLYKMRWNPDAPATHQYATHVRWAEIQANKIAQIYQEMSNFILEFEIPNYVNQPGGSERPEEPKPSSPTYMEFPEKVEGKTTDAVNLRKEPTTTSAKLATSKTGDRVTVHGKNGTWYKVTYAGQVGWMHQDYVQILNMLEVIATTNLNVRSGPSTTDASIGKLAPATRVAVVLKEDGAMIREKEWYQVYYNGRTGWISGGPNGTSYVKAIN